MITQLEKYGPVNSVVLTRSAESDNIYLQDENSIAQNGLCEIKIADNQIMNWNDRSDYLPDILEKLDGLEYYLNDFSSTGIAYLDLCDRYNIEVFENTYSCVMFNDELLVTQGLEENIYTDMPEETETDYTKADKTDRKINGAYIIADKKNAEIKALVNNISSDLNNNYLSKEQTEELILNAKEGLTNTFTKVGGNNLLKNSALFFKTDNVYDFWSGNAEKIIYNMAQSNTAISLKKSSFKQSVNLTNDSYTISFKFEQKNTLGTASVTINNEVINLTESGEIKRTYDINNNLFEIEFNSTLDDSYIIYDLMLNSGTEASSWSQYQNEVHTDTVNISKGITIEATENDTIGRFGADGVKVENKYTNEIVLKATDTGIETTDTKSNTGTIGGISMKKTGNQSWIVGV